MAVLTSSAMNLRKHLIMTGLIENGAVSPETAKTLEEARVENPELFQEYTEQLVDYGFIQKTKDGKYWVNEGEQYRSFPNS